MLTSARLRDDALLAHALREQCLPESIVDLVGARVQEILALEEDLRAAVILRELVCVVEVRRTACVLAQVHLELILEIRIVLVLSISRLELIERRHDDFRHILSTKFTKSALRVHLCTSFLISISHVLWESGHILLFWIHCTGSGHQARLRSDIIRPDESLADEDAVAARRAQPPCILTREDAALADQRALSVGICGC